MKKMMLPDAVNMIISRLRAHGYSADVVGGAVRDHLLGRDVTDYDITTSCAPNELKSLFSDIQSVDTGIKHGTVTLVIDRVHYEVTAYRTDGEYNDARHPDTVIFGVSLDEDLARRDFTVNAICYNPYTGYTDLYDGVGDLQRGLIRAVGDAERRFGEDALRIMRAIRFAAVLGFGIESATDAAVHKCKALLSRVSAERIYTELQKLIMGEDAYRILQDYRDVIGVILPMLAKMELPDREAFASADYMTRLLSLFMLNCDAPADEFDAAMRRLRTDNLTRTLGSSILSAYSELDFSDTRAVAKLLYRYGRDTVLGGLKLGVLLARFTESAGVTLDKVSEENIPYEISRLNIRGGDIIDAGLVGEQVGDMLRRLLFAVIDGECANDRESLIGFVQKAKKII